MRVSEKEIARFVSDVLSAQNVGQAQRESVVRNIVWNELDGRANFGLQRLPIYVERLRAGGINAEAQPTVTHIAEAATRIDGDNAFGQYAGELAIQSAIGLATEQGIGCCGVRASNFFGSGAYFVNLACEANMVGIAMSNSFPKVAAHNGQRAALGTNPFAFGAPLGAGRTLMVDFATSALAGSTLRDYQDKGQSPPPNSVVETDGDRLPVLLPFGGAKGFGLALLVETLAGVLTGAGVSGDVKSMYRDIAEPGENGHVFLAIDISKWMAIEDFTARMAGLEALLMADEPARLPGAQRARIRKENISLGVEVSDVTLQALSQLAGEIGVKTLGYKSAGLSSE